MGPCIPWKQSFRYRPVGGSSCANAPPLDRTSARRRSGMNIVSGSSLTIQSALRAAGCSITLSQKRMKIGVFKAVLYCPPRFTSRVLSMKTMLRGGSKCASRRNTRCLSASAALTSLALPVGLSRPRGTATTSLALSALAPNRAPRASRTAPSAHSRRWSRISFLRASSRSCSMAHSLAAFSCTSSMVRFNGMLSLLYTAQSSQPNMPSPLANCACSNSTS
mmetsp:Transcript_49455/g.150503  ORF Transcript_49455/g.150503 Transcript_49455/m.150503 type:complete len:221 (+) Transcript_49455:407-1069(+)